MEVGGVGCDTNRKIMPLRGPSCKLKLAKISAEPKSIKMDRVWQYVKLILNVMSMQSKLAPNLSVHSTEG